MTKRQIVSATIEAQNTFTDHVSLNEGDMASISMQPGAGTTVTVQHRLDGVNWRDVASYTADDEKIYDAGSGVDVRVGVKTGDYGASTGVRIQSGG